MPIMNIEMWAVIADFPAYKISSIGRVERIKTGRIMKPANTIDGYPQVSMRNNGSSLSRRIHTLVAMAFLGDRPEGMTINHKDGNKENNHARNLEYISRGKNIAHAYATGLRKPIRGKSHWCAKLTQEQVKEIRELYALGFDSQMDIAKEFGVDQTTVSGIVKFKSRKHE